MGLRTWGQLPGWSRAVAIAVVLALVGGGAIAALARPPGAPGLAQEGIAADPCAPQDVLTVPVAVRGHYLPGTSVLRTSGGAIFTRTGPAALTPALAACVQAAGQASRHWLAAGNIPGATGPQRSMATRALLDLRLLTRPDGAVLAAVHNGWRYA